MDFNDTQEEAKFRKEAYEWLKANAPLKEGKLFPQILHYQPSL